LVSCARRLVEVEKGMKEIVSVKGLKG